MMCLATLIGIAGGINGATTRTITIIAAAVVTVATYNIVSVVALRVARLPTTVDELEAHPGSKADVAAASPLVGAICREIVDHLLVHSFVELRA